MKIPEHIRSRLGDSPAFLLVTSKQEAALYAINGEDLAELGSFVVERPADTDKEGEFKSRSRGGSASGTAYERTDDAQIRDFTSLMEVMARSKLYGASGRLYAFAPAAVKSHLMKALGGSARSLEVIFTEGNYMHSSPVDLLDKIAREFESKRVVPTDPAAQRILDIPI
ncbi:MAG TPA: hypothetical protein VHF05_03395 [Candidatus Paceibacterota bacterium]|jgi:hypothetical protein|nr:hypothetical protein [Candidatus Paceibacterota bacterium]